MQVKDKRREYKALDACSYACKRGARRLQSTICAQFRMWKRSKETTQQLL